MNFLTAAVSGQLIKHQRLISLARLLAGYSFVQILVQGVGFLTGILIVRTLNKEDYAYYVIVNTVGPVMSMLSDTGVNNSLTALGGKFWQDDVKMGSLIRTAMLLRRRLFFFSCLMVAPVLGWMLHRNQATVITIIPLIAIASVGVLFQLSNGVLGAVISLRQQVKRMQTLAFTGALPRLAVIALLAALGWLNAPLTVAAATATLAIQFWLLKRWVKPQVQYPATPDAEMQKDIIAIVKRAAPFTIYFCLQSQIGIWLISIFGNPHNVAEVGALGRIGALFGIVITTTSAVIIPRFARCQDLPLLRRRYVWILLGFSGLVAVCVLLTWMFPYPVIWLVGPQYKPLEHLVWLTVLGVGNFSIAGLVGSLNYSKAWIPPATIMIPAEILTQVVLCLVFDISTVLGILCISAIAPVIPALINLIIGLQKLRPVKPSITD